MGDHTNDAAASDSGIESKGSWYTDDEQLLGEVRASRASRGTPPLIRGYSELRELRRGGQGIVYTAIQTSTRRRVAIKVLLEGSLASESSRRRFEREIEVVAGLRHPNIVRVYDSGSTDGPGGSFPYYVMEFVDGMPLNEATAALRTNVRDGVTLICELFIRLADAVNFAHQRGVIHRDLKPSNVRVEAGEPRILDFGLAKHSAPSEVDNTVTGASAVFIGSLPWASPEQAEGDQSQVDVRSDVYSIGVMLYQSLSGSLPYDVSGSMHQTLHNILRQEPSELSSSIGQDLRTIVRRCLAKERDRRYQTAGDVAEDLRHFLAGEPIRARRDSLVYTLQRAAQRNQIVLAASGAVMLALGAGLAWAMKAEYQATRARDVAASSAAQKDRTVDFLRQMLESAAPENGGRDTKVVDVLNKISADLDGGVQSLPPTVEAVARSTLGSTYGALGFPDKAEANLRAAMKALEALPEGTHAWEWLDASSTLGLQISRQGKVDEGLAVTLAAWNDAAKHFGPEAPHTLALHARYGETLYNAGQFKASLAELEAVAVAQARVLGADNPATVETRQNVAILYRQTSRPLEAERIYNEVLTHIDRAKAPLLYAGVVHNLASALKDLGKLDEAASLYHQAIDIRTRLYGADHPSTLLSMSDLSTVLIDQEKLQGEDGAVALLRNVVTKLEARSGPRGMDTLVALCNLAKAVQDAGDLNEAQTLFQKAYEGQSATLGPEHPQTLITLSNIAVVYARLKQPEKSLELSERILDIQRRTLGPDNFSTVISLNNVGKLYDDLERGEDAERAYRETVERSVRTMQPGHFSIPLFKNNLARRLFANGKRDEAYSVLHESLDASIALYGNVDQRVKNIARKLVLELEKDGRREEAATLRTSHQLDADPTKPATK